MNTSLIPKGNAPQKFSSKLVNQTPVYDRKARKKKKSMGKPMAGKGVKWM